MAFEVFQSLSAKAGIPRGMLSLSPRGMARCNATDLAAVGIVDRATILIDREGRSIALRAPLDIEEGQRVGAEHRGSCKTVWLAGAIKALGALPVSAGWYPCRIVEDRIEFCLAGATRKRGAAKAG